MVPSLGDREIVYTTLRNRCGVLYARYAFYDNRDLDVLADEITKAAAPFRGSIEPWIDAVEREVLRREFSLAEDIVGVDA